MADAAAAPSLTAAELIDAAQAAYDRATLRTGEIVLERTLAGRPVRMTIAGDAFGPILDRAIAGEAGSGEAAAFTLRAWDAASTGAPITSGTWLGLMLGPAGMVEELSRPPYAVSFDVHASLVGAVDLAAATAFHYVPDPIRLPPWEATHPARLIWAAWARSTGLLLCHAAAVADGEAGVLLVGPGGSGKSTTAMACLGAGLRCAGDDYVLVDVGERPGAHALYRSVSLEADHAERHAQLLPVVDRVSDMGAGRTKAIMVAGEGGTRGISGGFPLAAIAVPRIRGSRATSFRRISAGEAMRALAPSTMSQLGQLDAGALSALGGICRRLPCYELDLGTDIATVPDGVRALARDARGATTATSADPKAERA